MSITLSPEQVVEHRIRFINAIGAAMLSDEHGAYPGNTALYNALLGVFEVWEAGEEARDAARAAAAERSCGCL